MGYLRGVVIVIFSVFGLINHLARNELLDTIKDNKTALKRL